VLGSAGGSTSGVGGSKRGWRWPKSGWVAAIVLLAATQNRGNICWEGSGNYYWCWWLLLEMLVVSFVLVGGWVSRSRELQVALPWRGKTESKRG